MQSHKPQATDSLKSNGQARRTAPACLPPATADLVNRLLAARCGSGR